MAGGGGGDGDARCRRYDEHLLRAGVLFQDTFPAKSFPLGTVYSFVSWLSRLLGRCSFCVVVGVARLYPAAVEFGHHYLPPPPETRESRRPWQAFFSLPKTAVEGGRAGWTTVVGGDDCVL